MNKDIFISYKDSDGTLLADKLSKALEERGFSVYYNPNEYRSEDFKKKLCIAVKNCKDFILIVSQACLNDLMGNNEKSWVRFELSIAKENNKNIIPILLNGTKMPELDKVPEKLQFLPMIDNIEFLKPEKFESSPLSELIKTFKSKAEKNDIYRDEYNNNPRYNVGADFNKTLEAAQNGDFKAMYEIGNMYFYGFSNDSMTSDRDFGKAYEWFKKLSDTENQYKAYADSMLARMYYDSTVPYEKQSYEKALEYHRKSADVLKFGYSAIRVAFMQQEGRGCEFDFDAIEKYYLNFVENGDDTIKMNLADFYLRYGKFKEAAEMYNSMDNSPSVAEYQLGLLYKLGVLSDPPKPDYIQASYHFQNAINCEYPHSDAANQLGLLYFAPAGNFRKNFKMAQKYFEIAAEMGNASAQYNLGYMYEFGYVKKDVKLAIQYFTLAANQGDINSPHHLAMLYQQSECRNYHKAFKYAQISASNSIPEGEFILANLLYIGRGCIADEAKAYEYYKRALEHGMEQAAFMIDKIDNR